MSEVTERVERQTRAITFADIVGYSRMMGEDEDRAFAMVEDYLLLVRPIIERTSGTLHKTMGDGLLISHASATDAVRCALAMQQEMRDRNATESAENTGTEPILVRIGIHVGDVIIQDGDLFGDGVNIAARIEPLATPGTVLVSQMVYDLVRASGDIRAVNEGRRDLKNIKNPVTVWRVLAPDAETLPEEETHGGLVLDAGASLPASFGEDLPPPPAPAEPAKAGLAGPVVGLGVVAAVGLAAFMYMNQAPEQAPPTAEDLAAKPLGMTPPAPVPEVDPGAVPGGPDPAGDPAQPPAEDDPAPEATAPEPTPQPRPRRKKAVAKAPDPNVRTGTLIIRCERACRVKVDGKVRGKAKPSLTLTLPMGSYKVSARPLKGTGRFARAAVVAPDRVNHLDVTF